MIRQIFSLILIATALFVSEIQMATAKPITNVVRWVVEKNSTMRVEGKSNINSFACNIKEYPKKDTIIVVNDPTKEIRLSGELQMDVLSFNCHSSLITKDLRKTLKAEEYPKFIIRFLSIKSMPTLQDKSELIEGWIEVELAGVVKQFELCYRFSKEGTGYIKLNGAQNFCFSDFKLSPPRKLAGMVKIKDDFKVNFQLILRPI
ncbi:MAG: hypothetical protein WKF91_10825 [Segetibacter sp.]